MVKINDFIAEGVKKSSHIASFLKYKLSSLKSDIKILFYLTIRKRVPFNYE